MTDLYQSKPFDLREIFVKHLDRLSEARVNGNAKGYRGGVDFLEALIFYYLRQSDDDGRNQTTTHILEQTIQADEKGNQSSVITVKEINAILGIQEIEAAESQAINDIITDPEEKRKDIKALTQMEKYGDKKLSALADVMWAKGMFSKRTLDDG